MALKNFVFQRKGAGLLKFHNFRAKAGRGMHFSPPTQALAPEKCAKPTYTPSISIKQAFLQAADGRKSAACALYFV